MPSEENHKPNDGADDDSSNSTVCTDDDEFTEFIESQWKDSVEIGLVITYPLPCTNYLESNILPSNDESTSETKIELEPVHLPPLTLSTVLKEESIAPLFDGTQWAGTRVWKAAVLGLEYLIRRRQLEGKKWNSFLELGCGLGVPGMVWKQLLDHERDSSSAPTENTQIRVVMTDMESLVPQLQANVAANFKDDSSIEAKPLDWSREGITELLEQEQERCGGDFASPVFDICLNCDCVYEPLYGRKAWESLADVMVEMARTSPETLLVTALERRNADNVEGFLERLSSSGSVQEIERVVRHEEDPHHVIEIYVTKGGSQSSKES